MMTSTTRQKITKRNYQYVADKLDMLFDMGEDPDILNSILIRHDDVFGPLLAEDVTFTDLTPEQWSILDAETESVNDELDDRF